MCGQAVFDGDATYAQLQEPTTTGSSIAQYRFMSFDMSSGSVEVSSIGAGGLLMDVAYRPASDLSLMALCVLVHPRGKQCCPPLALENVW